ncbi:MAG TPA: hypothetical protein PLX17_00480 [Chitinophagaceae bacterium]|nr:hypothetical protein [Chitinophagaceae bacterium]
MKKVLLFLFAAVLISFIPEPEKEYVAKLSLQEWNILISDQGDVAPNARKGVIQKVVGQIQPQIQADTIKNKK